MLPVNWCNTAFIGGIKAYVIPTPNNPDNNPIINVSALNTRLISFFLAPNAFKIPISFVLSKTEIYIIIPIIILDTTNEIAEILTIPANSIIEKLTELANVAQLNPLHAIILLTISIVLTVIGGYIPAKVASKKDAVESLRTE